MLTIPEVVGDAGECFNPKNIEEIREAIENVVLQWKNKRT